MNPCVECVSFKYAVCSPNEGDCLGDVHATGHDSSSEGEPVGEQSKLIGLALNVTYSSRVIHLEMVQLPCHDRRTGTKKMAGTSYAVALT